MSKRIDNDIYLLKDVTNLQLSRIEGLITPDSKDIRIYKSRTFVVVLSIDDEKKHLSISHAYRYPTWDEIKYVKYEFLKEETAEIEMAMYFPKPAKFVNIHKNCFHLYEV